MKHQVEDVFSIHYCWNRDRSKKMYFWSVFRIDSVAGCLQYGATETYDQALRNVRYYIKSHQNEVYG